MENVRNNENLDKILELNLENVKVCFDLGHAHCYGNEYNLFNQYKNNIACSHLHNNYGTDSHNLLDDGEINYKDFLTKLYNIKSSSNCIESFPPINSHLNKQEFEQFVNQCYLSIQ